jgi:streptogramin lyase
MMLKMMTFSLLLFSFCSPVHSSRLSAGSERLASTDNKVNIREYDVPVVPDSRPYGIASTRDGVVWYSEAGVKPNTLIAFDPKTKSFQSWPIPSGGGVVRNMVATPDDKLYLACSGVNKVAIAEVKH